ncbi:MAG: protein kinase [Chloroflexi bacterium]|nr:protein kinase [Chloroflexota bacterium]
MPSERVKRQIDRMLDGAEAAAEQRDWPLVAELARKTLIIDRENEDAKVFLAMSEQEDVTESASPSGPVDRSDTPTSFANGRYSVTRLLGEGGKKKVYLAHDAILDRDVAFAVIKTEGLDEVGRERIRREAQAMGRMGTHPCIMPIYDLGEEDGNPYMVQPLMSGGDVEELIEDADGPLPLEQALQIATQTAQGLVFAHSKGIVHRDLKPGNIWLDEDGAAKIGDFGLAVATDRSRLTVEKMMVGTVNYMPPEQATGGDVTPRADLYSLGAMLYEMCTGRVPFMGDDDIAVISQHVNTPPVAPSWHNPNIPRTLDSLIIRLMSKDPDERPQSADEVLVALEAVDLSVTEESDEASTGSLDSMAGGVFVGRQREMDQLKSIFEDMLSGRGRMAMLVGEPGIGKTRTAQELATYAGMRGARVLWGRSYESGGAPPYWPWVQVIRSYVASTDPDVLRGQMGSTASVIAEVVADVREKFPDLPEAPSIDDPESARFRLFDSIATFLKNASGNQPLILMLEDLHWSDKPSLMLLEFVARELANAKIMVVGNYRDVELNRRHPLSVTLGDLTRDRLFERILLRGLQKHDVARFIEIAAGMSPPPALVETVYSQTEGNPLFVTETVRLLIQEGDITAGRAAGGGTTSWEIRIPEGVREVIGRRLDRLSERSNEMLTIAAIIGRQFRFDVLRQLVEDTTENQLLDALDEALSAKIIEELPDAVDHYQFNHALMQETLTGELSLTRRVRLHARIAEALEKTYGDEVNRYAAELAYHYSEAEAVLGTEKLVHYSVIAGEEAFEANAPLAAVAHFERAAKAISEHSSDRIAARVERGVGLAGLAAARLGSEYQAPWESVARAFGMFVDIGDNESAVSLAARAVYPVAAVSGTASVLERALELAPEDSVESGHILGRLFLALMLDDGEEERSEEFANQAERIAKLTGDNATEMLVQAGRAVIAGFRGESSASLNHGLRALKLAESGHDLQSEWYARYFSGAAYLVLGDRQQALTHIDGMLGLSERYGVSPIFALGLRELRNLLLGEWETLRRPKEDPTDDVVKSVTFDLNIAVADAQTGRDVAFDPLNLLTKYDPRSPSDSTVSGSMPKATFIASILLDTPHRTIADQIARVRSLGPETMRHDKFLTLEKDLAAATAFNLHRDTPSDHVQRAYERLDPLKKSAYSMFSVDRLRGRLAIAFKRFDDASEHFEDALDFCRGAEYRPELAWTCLDYSEMLLGHDASGDRDKATELQDEAIAIATKLGMQPLLKRVLAQREILKA